MSRPWFQTMAVRAPESMNHELIFRQISPLGDPSTQSMTSSSHEKCGCTQMPNSNDVASNEMLWERVLSTPSFCASAFLSDCLQPLPGVRTSDISASNSSRNPHGRAQCLYIVGNGPVFGHGFVLLRCCWSATEAGAFPQRPNACGARRPSATRTDTLDAGRRIS